MHTRLPGGIFLLYQTHGAVNVAGPIKPEEVSQQKEALIPSEVFEVFNRLIAEDWDEDVNRAIVDQGEAAEAIASALHITKEQVYDRHLLNVEPAYRRAGWLVEYDKPSYCETYPATFTFRKSTR